MQVTLILTKALFKSKEARSLLLQLPNDNPDLYKQLSAGNRLIPDEVEPAFKAFEDGDDSAVSIDAIKNHLTGELLVSDVAVDEDGYLAQSGLAESVDATDADLVGDDNDFEPEKTDPIASGSSTKMDSIGTRTRRKPTVMYDANSWESY
ncbi:hypothetical protein C8J56DRAFT_1037847 [Mycena floridula]|nr:hypothetical protein C8J56DRAFT_1037847 [Mycena floridula]